MKTTMDSYKQVSQILSSGKAAAVVSYLSETPYQPVIKKIIQYPILPDWFAEHGLPKELATPLKQAFDIAEPVLVDNLDDGVFLLEPHYPEPRLFIFGGGHIAQPLVAFASQAGFSTTVVDDRPSFANPDRFPLAEMVVCESFIRCFDLLDINASDFVVIITRGHRHDLDCLRQVLNRQTAYTGMIGSRRRIELAWKLLLEEGFSNSQLAHVHAPIGLPIGAITPVEIAISIVSQLICAKRLGTLGSGKNNREENREVLESLAVPSSGPRAIVTVIAAKGSVPRKPGAKMIVWPDGSLIGSIGGGCSESEVILVALEVIRKGNYRRHRVDMTGTSAEENGMVCGGVMDVLIEPCG